jgi:23S rRNA (uracil1939-C5)-methyltransferase
MVCDGALPDEQVRVTRYKRRRRLAIAQDFEITRPSEARAVPICRYFEQCGGCQLQQAHYDAQLAYKQNQLKQAFLEYGAVSPAHWLATLADGTYHYRRRVRLGVRSLADGNTIIGFHRKNHSYLLDIRACPVIEPRLHMLLEPLHQLVPQLSVRQRLPQIEMSSGESDVAVVFCHLLPLSFHDRQLLSAFAEQQSVLVFTQAGGPDSLRPLQATQRTDLQYSFTRHQTQLSYGPADFVQANDRVNQLLVDQVIAQLDIQPQDRVLELFCGNGNFSLPLARYAYQVIGVEGHPGLVARAVHNADQNGIRNVRFVQADLRQWTPDMPYDKLLLDPPREGAIEVIKRLPETSANTIVYVSCQPRTLARDARYLVHHRGYTLSRAGLVDMFPQTKHIEAIAVFTR